MMDQDLAKIQLEGATGSQQDADYEYGLEDISVGSSSFTNSEHIKVVDDVKEYEISKNEGYNNAVILMTDDESASINSVLIVESNTIEAWDTTDSVHDDEEFYRRSAERAVSNVKSRPNIDQILAKANSESGASKEDGDSHKIFPNEEYWLKDCEVIADKHSLLYIKPERRTVYSVIEPARWPLALRGKELTRISLDADWRPKSSMRAYPIDRLVWVNDYITLTSKLIDSLDPDDAYALLKWPPFDLLEMDNRLLRLSTLMLIKGGTVADLATKINCDPKIVCGFVNACYRAGYIINRSDLTPERLPPGSEPGVLGMIKDAFR